MGSVEDWWNIYCCSRSPFVFTLIPDIISCILLDLVPFTKLIKQYSVKLNKRLINYNLFNQLVEYQIQLIN